MSKCLFKKELRYVSYDMGNSWQATGEFRKGSLIAQGSSLCPEPAFDGKFRATYTGGTTYSAACDSNTTLSSRDTTPSGYDYYSMTSAEIGSCITSIGNGAFYYYDSLTSVTLGSGVTTIGVETFAHTSLTSVTIPDSVTSIGENAFYQCESLTSCTIGTGVTSLGIAAFNGCTGLTSVTIPSGVTSIGKDAFNGCSGLTSIRVDALTPPTLGEKAFDNTNAPIYVPAQSLSAYQSAWSTYSSRIQAIP